VVDWVHEHVKVHPEGVFTDLFFFAEESCHGYSRTYETPLSRSGFVFLEKRQGSSEMKKSIAFFANGLGNFVLMMPALQAVASLSTFKKVDICLDDRWDDSRRPAVMDICRAWECVDKIFSWPKEQFRESDYKYWFVSGHGETGSAVVPVFLKRCPILAKPNWIRTSMHEEDHYFHISRIIGYMGDFPEVNFPLAPDPILNLPRPIIGLCNGWFRTRRKAWEKKGWPHFTALSRVMKNYFGGSVIGLGGPGEMPEDAALDADYCGKLPILNSAKALSQVDLLVTTDTGLMHIANLLKTPLIALFGPTLVSKNGPRHPGASVIQSSVDCAPCLEKTAFYNCAKNLCMDSITVSDVMVLAKDKLKGIH